MDRRGVSMDAGQGVWDWEVLPDHMSSSMCDESANLADDQETKEPIVMPPSGDADVHDEPVDECKDIGVVLDETVTNKKEAMPEVTDPMDSEGVEEENETVTNKKEAMPEVTDPMDSEGVEEEKTLQRPDTKKVKAHDQKFDEEEASEGDVEEKTFQSLDTTKARDEKFGEEEASEGEVEEKTFQSPDTKEAHDEKFDEEEEEDTIKKDNGAARPDCVVFSLGKLKVNGIGALCSFGVAAATVCIFLIGGKLQHHHRQQEQKKIQLQLYGDDKRIQQVVQQTSRLNEAMSSVMGGGASTRANISFGGFYDGF